MTYIAVAPAGHFLTMDAPAVAFRSMEVLLGRVEGFQSMAPFTTDTNRTAQPSGSMGNGTVLIVNGGVEALQGNGVDAASVQAAVSRAGKAAGRGASFAGLVVLLGVFMVW